MEYSVSAWMEVPPIVTARLVGLSRAPPHDPQAMGDMYCSMRSRMRLD